MAWDIGEGIVALPKLGSEGVCWFLVLFDGQFKISLAVFGFLLTWEGSSFGV